MSRSACPSCAPRRITAPPSISPAPARPTRRASIAALRLAARLASADNRAPLRRVVTDRARRPAAAARGHPPARSHRQKSLGQNFLLDLNLAAPHRAGRRTARRRHGVRGRPRPGRADARAARARAPRASSPSSATSARIAALARNRRALSRPARRSSQATRSTSIRSAISMAARAHRRQPALQHRDRPARLLAVRRAVAALVRSAGADVPARSRRAHRGGTGLANLRPAVGARRWRCEARILFDVAASAFVPPPKVTSSLVG